MGIRSNNSAQSFFDIFTGTGTRASGSGGGGGGGGFVEPNGHTASGGIISDYEESGTVYRSHTFINPGTFVVSELSSVHPANIEYLVVGGGGGGGGSGYGSDGQGGGGAGGLRSNHPSMSPPTKGPDFAVEVATYNVSIGEGGFGGNMIGNSAGNAALGRFGKETNFYKNGINYPSTQYIRGIGGGRAGAFGASNSYRNGEPGGSGGGGAGGSDGAGGNGNQPAPPNNWPQPVGNPGGSRGPNYTAGGGGGFVSAGQNGDGTHPGDGGAGINLTMEGTTVGYAGGGSGGAGGPGRPDPGSGHGVATHGGGTGGPGRPNSLPNFQGGNGVSGTGGGGGGCSSSAGGDAANPLTGWGGGAGGPGIVVVRYQIGQKNTAKATGGAISFYDGKTIHTFRNPGTFTASEALTAECVLIGGGGGGGYQNAGGGGAGGYQHVASHPFAVGGYNVTVGEFGQGNGNGPSTSNSESKIFTHGGDTSLQGANTAYTVKGGGGGGNESAPGHQGGESSGSTGGSGGGGGRFGNSPAQGGTFGRNGGIGAASTPHVAGGGGGGAGGNGENGFGPTSEGGHGGIGVQLPATFRDPNGFKFGQGPDDSYFWVAGGGAGGSGNPGGSRVPMGGTGPSGAPSPRCGGGGGGTPYNFSSHTENRVAPNSTSGLMGTGGGGGGGGEGVGGDPYLGPRAGSPGGSGIVLIAYPS